MTPETLAATVRLGVKLSVVAAILAVALPLIGDVSRWPLVVAIATLGSVSSWIQSGRVERGEAPLLSLDRLELRSRRLG
jgi:hypothetical protein